MAASRHDPVMDPRTAALLTTTKGVASGTELRALGTSDRDLTRAVRAGELVRIRKGAYVEGDLWRAAKPWERHELRARAVFRSQAGTTAVLSHHSALAVHGVALHGVDDRVHLLHTDGRRGRTDAGLRMHRPVPAPFVMEHEGIRVVAPAAACVQVAAQFGAEAGLVSADAALHRGLISQEDLATAMSGIRPDRWSRAPSSMVALADPRIESAAESRARWCFHVVGLDQPTPQVVLRDEWGEPWARLDFLVEDLGVVIEVDGLGKYGDLRDLHAEKAREDRLRELGYEVVRLTWADLADPEVVRRKVERAVARARRRRAVSA